MNNNHEKFKKAMKTAGLILLAVGIVFIVIGAVDFAQAFKGENRPEKFWAFFVGFPLFAPMKAFRNPRAKPRYGYLFCPKSGR